MVETDSSLDDMLKGKTLQIYWYLILTGRSGVREIQKELNISSSSTVHYHLNKLLNAGLVNQDRKAYDPSYDILFILLSCMWNFVYLLSHIEFQCH